MAPRDKVPRNRAPRDKGGVYVALLRGINVGGKHKLPMKELVALFEGAGCSEVRTYIQSGNVVFRATKARATRIPSKVARAVHARFGFSTPVVLRTAAELTRVARGNPFLRAGAPPNLLHVAFLAERPPRAQVALLDPGRSPPDELTVKGREVYLRLPNGVGRTKLTNSYLDRTLGTVSTVRNWRTVLKLVEMGR